MIKLKDLISEENLQSDQGSRPEEPAVSFEVGSNSHETKTVSGQSVFLTNLRRDVINVELKSVNGVVFVTVK
jgi:hypothetical protein